MAYLIGDIGGTKTHLSIVTEEKGNLVSVKDQKFLSQNYLNLDKIVKEFLKESNFRISKACFGIAGVVKEGKCQATNLPWFVDCAVLEKELEIEKVSLINDLEANAYGLNMLTKEEFFILNEGCGNVKGNQAMISPGTGLGEAGIFFDGKKHVPFACEGGHVDFAPKNKIEDKLLKYLRKKFIHVSYERILSGPGLYNLYQFIVDTNLEKEDPEVFKEIQKGNSTKIISEKAKKGISKACSQALDIFISIYGAETGNLALKMLATGGVFLGGGMTPKILGRIKQGGFLSSFIKKGRFSKLLSITPVWVVLNENTALLGAKYYVNHIM